MASKDVPEVVDEDTLNHKKKQLTAITDIASSFISNPQPIR